MTVADLIAQLKLSDLIAGLALILSGLSIFWNIYRDVLLRPRLRVRVQISIILRPDPNQKETFIDITATNHGPGIITCESILARRRELFRWVRPRYLFIVRDYTNPLSAQLPKKLEVGDSITLLFHYKEKQFLAWRPTHVGIKDSFGRLHWAERASVKEAVDAYLKDFSEVEWKRKSESEAPSRIINKNGAVQR